MTKTVDVCFSKLLKWERKSMSATNDISDNNNNNNDNNNSNNNINTHQGNCISVETNAKLDYKTGLIFIGFLVSGKCFQ